MIEADVHIVVDNVRLEGELIIPEKVKGIVIFSHGSGSSRLSPRNRLVAERLNQNDLATLLFDLLTEEEDTVYASRFNIPLLTDRLVKATQWAKRQKEIQGLPIGYFGASTGAASALFAAAQLPKDIQAVVSRGGRPDLAMETLHKVQAPTLLIVGDLNHAVIEMNRAAYDKLRGKKGLILIPGATHLFEEPGKLELVAQYSAEWYLKYLVKQEMKEQGSILEDQPSFKLPNKKRPDKRVKMRQ